MSADQDFLAQILKRVTRKPALGARVDTDVVALADNVGAGVSARSLLATVGKAAAGTSDAMAMAESNSFELHPAAQSIGSDEWEVRPPASDQETSAYVADWGELGLKVGDIAIFANEMAFAEITGIENATVAGSSYAKIEFSNDPGLPNDGADSNVSSQRARVSSLIKFPVKYAPGRLFLDGVYPGLRRGDLVLVEHRGEYILRHSAPEMVIQEIDNPEDEDEWNNDRRWEWRRTLLDSVRDDRHFTLEDGTWRRIRGFRTPAGELVHRDWAANAGYTVRFGDGEFGQIPADGTMFRVHYRSGPGSFANVNSDTIVLLVDPVEGGPQAVDFLTAVNNPFAVTSGVDLEDMQRVKFLAPEAFRHDLPRAVRPDDYTRLAESLSWVQKANATFRWTGSWLTVFVAVDPRGAYSMTADQRAELEDLLDGVRQVGRDVVVLEPDYLDLDLGVRICVKPGYYAGHVEAAVLEALTGVGGFFDPDQFTFGTPLRRTRLEAAIQAVEGVAAVRSVSLRVRDLTGWEKFEQAVLTVGPGQIVRVANDRRHPERGTLRVSVVEVVG